MRARGYPSRPPARSFAGADPTGVTQSATAIAIMQPGEAEHGAMQGISDVHVPGIGGPPAGTRNRPISGRSADSSRTSALEARIAGSLRAAMRVFLTGGTGFIGGHVARKLRERGDDVRALVRSAAKGAELEALGCELVVGDLSDEAAITAGLEGCDALIHNAAVYEVGIPESEHRAMYEANVLGTEKALRRGARREHAEGRLRLDRRRVRQHPRRGRRRDATSTRGASSPPTTSRPSTRRTRSPSG